MSNILFIGMNFYYYEDVIVERLRKRGNLVFHYAEKDSFLKNHIPFLSDKVGDVEKGHYLNKILAKIKGRMCNAELTGDRKMYISSILPDNSIDGAVSKIYNDIITVSSIKPSCVLVRSKIITASAHHGD